MDASSPHFLTRTDRPRMLYVVPQHDYSGAEMMQLPVLRTDTDPLVACPAGSRVEALMNRNDIPTVALPYRLLRHSEGPVETLRSLYRGLAGVRDLRRLLRAHPERSIIYCTGVRAGMLATLAKARLGRRTVWILPDFAPSRPMRWLVDVLAHGGCDHAIALSTAVAQDFAGDSERRFTRTTVVHPGTDFVGRVSAGTPGRPRAGVIGQVSPTKRTDLAIEVARLVAKERSDFELVVIGRAQYRRSDFEFERQLQDVVAHDPATRELVSFRGYVSDVAAELTSLGLLLHCRPDEPFGIVLIEAMAVGLPVVAPAAAGPAEIVDDGVTGLLYAPGDAEDAARQVLRILNDPEEAARIGAAARSAVETGFTAGGQLIGIDLVLQQVADGMARQVHYRDGEPTQVH
jgi:glycosyltransferase involved in cell wall biosynthesis